MKEKNLVKVMLHGKRQNVSPLKVKNREGLLGHTMSANYCKVLARLDKETTHTLNQLLPHITFQVLELQKH